MTYKNRLVCLLSLIALLSLLYTGSLIFSPEQNNKRSASFVWLEPRLSARINTIEISPSQDSAAAGQKIELAKKNNMWVVLHNGNEYPARQLRVEDFIGIFTSRAAWPVRSSSASSHTFYGLDSAASSKVIIYGENTVLLELLIGNSDNTGREIYLRKAAQNEVRSGENRIAPYITGSVTSWYNLRLIPESENGELDIESVQRLTVFNGTESQTFSRFNRGWDISGINVENPAQDSIENYIRIVLNTEGDNFAGFVSGNEQFNHSRIVFEFGNGRVTTIRFSEPDENGRLFAHVSGSEYIYAIPSWVAARLFRDAASFER
ncbi:MAG: DUF4340 domain-containing protein [Treponema sp.]|nr:DUF4340 domain-containing protein [Treponema sp.]